MIYHTRTGIHTLIILNLSVHVVKHIPLVTIKSKFTLPWFDSDYDCHKAYREKERAHKNFKERKNESTELTYKTLRCSFTKLGNKRMRDN